MSEATENKIIEEKPYTFRKLSSADVFLMFRIISKIGINEFMSALEGESISRLVKSMSEKTKNGEKVDESDSAYMLGALAGLLEIANVILGNISKCEKEIYQLLEQTSNLSVEEIKAEGNAVMFVEMVIDFLKKPEFPDFIKVVSRLFK